MVDAFIAVHGDTLANVEHGHQHWEARRHHGIDGSISYAMCSWLYVVFGS
jgi:hypothetical protein